MDALLIPSLSSISAEIGISTFLATVLLIAITLWSLALKGVGLWYAARNHQKRWFIAMLVLNTVGVLEIVYLIWFRADKKSGHTPSLFEAPTAGSETDGKTSSSVV